MKNLFKRYPELLITLIALMAYWAISGIILFNYGKLPFQE